MSFLTPAFNKILIIKQCLPSLLLNHTKSFHTAPILSAWTNDNVPKKFIRCNDIVYPPQKPDEAPRPAFVCHQRTNIKYSPFKMWYVACLVRGMSVDEAIKQLKFVQKKGAVDVREVIEEAKELAIKEHNVEYASNMWVAESFVGKGKVIKGLRRHARRRFGIIQYMHCHYFVRLEEGEPPKNYYNKPSEEPHDKLQAWLESRRKRKITSSL